MKRKHVITTLALSMLLGVGVFAGITANRVREAKADGTKTIYCKCEQGWWKTDGAAVGVYYWGGTTPKTDWPGVRMEAVEEVTDTWKYDVPDDITGLIFTRVNGSGAVSDWGAKTADLTLPTNGDDLYTITSTSAVWGEPGVAGEWSKYEEPVTPEPDPVYKVTIAGGEAQTLVANPDNDSEVKLASDVTLTAGQTISFTKDEEALAVTAKAGGTFATNNIDAELKIKKTVTGNLYLNKSSKEVWVTGYEVADGNAYLVGSLNSWSGIEYGSVVYTNVATFQNIDLEADAVFKAYVYEEDGATEDAKKEWVNPASVEMYADYHGEYTATIDDPDGNKNVKVSKAGNYDIFINVATRVYTIKVNGYIPPVEPEYALKVNTGAPIALTKDGDQYYAKDVEVAAGDKFAFTKDEAAFEVEARDVGNNNYGKNGIRKAGTVDIYLKPSTNDFWVSGTVAPEETEAYYMLVNDMNPTKMTYNDAAQSESEYYLTHVEVKVDDEISFLYVGTGEYATYSYYNIQGLKEGSVDFYQEDSNKVKADGIYDIYADMEYEHNVLYVALNTEGWVRYLDINGTKHAMTVNPEKDYEYMFTTNLVAGDELAYYFGPDATSATEQTSSAKAVYNNNLGADKKVLVDADNATVCVNINNGEIWVGGIATAGYHIIKNGHTLVAMTHGDEYDGYDQWFSASIEFAKDDEITFINATEARGNQLPEIFGIGTVEESDEGAKFEVVEGTPKVIKAKEAVTTKVYLKLKYGMDRVYFGAEDQYIHDAKVFANQFKADLDTACKASGQQKAVEDAWKDAAEAFALLAKETKDELKLGDLSSVEEVREFGVRYAWFLEHKSTWNLENFLEWDIQPANTAFGTTADDSVMTIVVIASISVISAAGLFFLIRRKRKLVK